MRFKKKVNYKRIPVTVNVIKSAPDYGREEKRRNYFFDLRKYRYIKMLRNERAQKKAARLVRKPEEMQKED